MPESIRIAVTGGSGAVGRFLVRCLLDRGHDVVNLDRDPGDDSRAQFVHCDIRDRNAIAPVLANCQAVCHLAEIPRAGAKFPFDEIYWSNTRSASVVLKTAADLGLRHAVYSSSCQVYGCWGEERIPPPRLPIDETCPLRPMNVYAVSKVANEMFAESLSRNMGLSTSIFRFPWVATRDFNDGELHRCEHDDGPLIEGFATFIHATDLALAFAAAIEISLPGCEVYNLSAEDARTVFPLRERLARHHPDFPPLPQDWPHHKSPLVIEKARTLLGWQPKWSFIRFFREWQGGH